jgi:hypothetical protein
MSDGGASPWSGIGCEEPDRLLGQCAGLAAVIPDRRRRWRQDLRTLVAQRVVQIAC